MSRRRVGAEGALLCQEELLGVLACLIRGVRPFATNSGRILASDATSSSFFAATTFYRVGISSSVDSSVEDLFYLISYALFVSVSRRNCIQQDAVMSERACLLLKLHQVGRSIKGLIWAYFFEGLGCDANGLARELRVGSFLRLRKLGGSL